MALEAITVDSPKVAAMMPSTAGGPHGAGSTPIILVLSISTLANSSAIGSDDATGMKAAARAVNRLRAWSSCAANASAPNFQLRALRMGERKSRIEKLLDSSFSAPRFLQHFSAHERTHASRT